MMRPIYGDEPRKVRAARLAAKRKMWDYEDASRGYTTSRHPRRPAAGATTYRLRHDVITVALLVLAGAMVFLAYKMQVQL